MTCPHCQQGEVEVARGLLSSQACVMCVDEADLDLIGSIRHGRKGEGGEYLISLLSVPTTEDPCYLAYV